MKKLLIFKLFIICLVTNNFAQRNTLWLSGMGATSPSWRVSGTINNVSANGYQLNELSTFSYTPHIDGIEGSATKMNQVLDNAGATNVLGIGHDGGGLVLRQMAKSSNRMTGMILCGVPNKGSSAIESMLPINGTSQINTLINQVLAFRSNAQSCNGCKVIEAFQNWANDINAQSSKYAEYQSNSPIIANLGTPNIPYAILWGNADKDALTLTRVLSSRANAITSGDDQGYLDCYRTEIQQRRTIINNAMVDGLTNAALSFANVVSSALNLSAGQNPFNAITGLANYIVSSIRTIRDNHLAMMELLECEMIHQGLNGQWNLIVSKDYEVRYYFYQSPPQVCCIECYYEPDPQIQGYCFGVCSNGTEVGYGFCESSQNYYIPYYHYKAHDGLLSEREQKIDNATQYYQVNQTNHFQESFYSNPNTQQALSDLFNGNAGTAFAIPH